MQAEWETLSLDNILRIQPKSLIYASAKFSRAQMHWHISQKEFHPVLHAIERYDWLLKGHGTPIFLYTDHKNVQLVLNPRLATKLQHLERLHRWGVRVQVVDLITVHVPGELNFFADLLSRLAFEEAANLMIDRKLSDPREEDALRKDPTITKLPRIRTRKTKAKEAVTYPKVEEVYQWAEKHRLSALSPYATEKLQPLTDLQLIDAQRKAGIEGGENELIQRNQKIYVPKNMLERVIVHNHLANRHRALKSEIQALEKFHFDLEPDIKLEEIVKTIRNKCLHCSCNHPALIKRPLDLTFLAKEPRMMLHSD